MTDTALPKMRTPIRDRFAAALPPVRLWLVGALVWGTLMATVLGLSLYGTERLDGSHTPALFGLYFSGGAIGWFLALPLIGFFSFRRRLETRFAAAFLLLSCGTFATTALLFALQYRMFYAQWHAPFGTVIWAFQFVFTSASAVYQFTALGSRHYFPFGVALLVAASLWLARRNR